MIIRNYANKILVLFLLLDPLYDWVAASAWNPRLAGVSLSDLYLMAILLLSGLHFVSRGVRSFLTDPYILLGLLILVDRLVVDLATGTLGHIDYVPRTVFNLVVYHLATQSAPHRTCWGWLAVAGLLTYLVFSLGQIPAALDAGGRLTSLFGNPNFLAFNALNLLVLLAMFPLGRRSNVLAGATGLVLLALSKTRSVLLASLWFLHRLVRRKRALVLVIATLAVVGFLSADFLRLGNDRGLSNLNGRVQIWRAIMGHFHQMDLIWGNGSNAASRFEIVPYFDAATGRVVGFTQPQNHYLLILIESGVVGLVLWLAQIAVYLRRLGRLPWDRVNRLAWSFVMALLTVQLLENEVFSNPTVRLIMGLAIAHGREALARGDSAGEAEEELAMQEGDKA